ncbi:MAG: fasciclin domain-containing protein [Alistipes senegalensis]
MYIPENKIVKALCCLAFLTASACIDAVDDYYTGGETATREGSVLEYLEKTPDYSDFVNLVAETGMTETLSGTDLVTVWAPANPMPAGVASMSPSEKIRLVRNHISITTVFSRNLDRLSTVGTLAGKYLTVEKARRGTPSMASRFRNSTGSSKTGSSTGLPTGLRPGRTFTSGSKRSATTIRASATRFSRITCGFSTRRTARSQALTRTAGSFTIRCGS